MMMACWCAGLNMGAPLPLVVHLTDFVRFLLCTFGSKKVKKHKQRQGFHTDAGIGAGAESGAEARVSTTMTAMPQLEAPPGAPHFGGDLIGRLTWGECCIPFNHRSPHPPAAHANCFGIFPASAR